MGYFRCWSVRNVLDLYADGRLTEGAAGRVAAHLAGCPSCSTSAEGLGSVRSLLAQVARAETPAGLAQSILNRLDAAEDVSWTAAPLRLNPAQGAALAYLALLLGVNLRPGIPSQGRGMAPPWDLEGRR